MDLFTEKRRRGRLSYRWMWPSLRCEVATHFEDRLQKNIDEIIALSIIEVKDDNERRTTQNDGSDE